MIVDFDDFARFINYMCLKKLKKVCCQSGRIKIKSTITILSVSVE